MFLIELGNLGMPLEYNELLKISFGSEDRVDSNNYIKTQVLYCYFIIKYVRWVLHCSKFDLLRQFYQSNIVIKGQAYMTSHSYFIHILM